MSSSSRGHLPQFAAESSLILPDPLDLAPEVSTTLDALEQFAQFVDELYDSPKPDTVLWEGNPNKIAIRSVGRLLCNWRHAVKPNDPPSALIVRLSRRLPGVLASVSERPKRILQRRRAMEPLNRLRELDSNCVRWLTRQPGITLAEKSGHRRSVLAVQRYESVDTLENRVVLDLLRRCIVLARDYLRQHERSFPNHERISMTADFLSLCRRLQSLPHLREVAGLPSLPKPNYVLLHESRYKQIWHAYAEVIRQQRRRQQLWAWRHRAFADMAIVALMNSVSRTLSSRRERKAAHRVEVHLRNTPLRGQFFDWSSPPPLWKLTDGATFFVGPPTLARHWSADAHAKLMEDDTITLCAVVQRASDIRIYGLKPVFPEDRTREPEDRDTRGDQVLLRCVDYSAKLSEEIQARSMFSPLAMVGQPHCLDMLISRWCST